MIRGRRFVVVVTILSMLLLMIAGNVGATWAGEESAAGLLDIKEYLFEVSDDMDDGTYCWTVEKNFRIIKNFEHLFTEESFKTFNRAHRVESRERAEACNSAINDLVQIQSVADRIWFLWDADNMPVLDGEILYPWQKDALSTSDYDGFVPFLIKYLQEDPSSAVGNLILVQSGYETRTNPVETYPAIPIFKELGYNVFLLQRRTDPYSDADRWMDMQRAIRLVRYHAQEEDWGGQDMIAAAGWSVGADAVLGAVEFLYGDLTPADGFDADYVPDEIDAVNSDLDTAITVYLITSELVDLDSNPNLPPFYMTHGELDDSCDPDNSRNLYAALTERGIDAQLFIVPNGGHGFYFKDGDGVENWPYEADAFMQAHRG